MTHSRRKLLTGIGLIASFISVRGYAMSGKLFDLDAMRNRRLAEEISTMMEGGPSAQEIEQTLTPDGLRAIHGMMTGMVKDMPGLRFGSSVAYGGPEGEFSLDGKS